MTSYTGRRGSVRTAAGFVEVPFRPGVDGGDAVWGARCARYARADTALLRLARQVSTRQRRSPRPFRSCDRALRQLSRRCAQLAAGFRAAGAADGPTLMGVGGRVRSGTLSLRFAYVSSALAAALIFSVETGRAFGPPPPSDNGSRYFVGRRG
jgi:hypothetical protein